MVMTVYFIWGLFTWNQLYFCVYLSVGMINSSEVTYDNVLYYEIFWGLNKLLFALSYSKKWY